MKTKRLEISGVLIIIVTGMICLTLVLIFGGLK